MAKKSIRFYNDREVRAVWDENHSKWWFSAIDIIRAINNEDDYVKAGNYWRWLKRKLSGDGVQLVSVTHDFKFEARRLILNTYKTLLTRGQKGCFVYCEDEALREYFKRMTTATDG